MISANNISIPEGQLRKCLNGKIIEEITVDGSIINIHLYEQENRIFDFNALNEQEQFYLYVINLRC